MYIDKHLNWNQHINELSKKLSQANGILSKLRYNMPLEVCIQVYYSNFYSLMIYGCNVWGLTSQKNINKIEVLQNKCIRILKFLPFDAHIPNQTFIDLKLLKVRDVIKVNQLKLVYDFQCANLPSDLLSLFEFSSQIRTRYQELNSVVNKLLYIPHFDTKTYGKVSLKYIAARLWNATFKTGSIQVNADRRKNVELSKIKTRHHLKNAVTRHYFYKYSLDV